MSALNSQWNNKLPSQNIIGTELKNSWYKEFKGGGRKNQERRKTVIGEQKKNCLPNDYHKVIVHSHLFSVTKLVRSNYQLFLRQLNNIVEFKILKQYCDLALLKEVILHLQHVFWLPSTSSSSKVLIWTLHRTMSGWRLSEFP